MKGDTDASVVIPAPEDLRVRFWGGICLYAVFAPSLSQRRVAVYVSLPRLVSNVASWARPRPRGRIDRPALEQFVKGCREC